MREQLCVLLAKYAGQNLTRELALQIIEGMRPTFAARDRTTDALTRWRSLIEPVVAGSANPVSWERLMSMPVEVIEGARSVLVTLDTESGGLPMVLIWVAAGDLKEVLHLERCLTETAKARGARLMGFLGRRGWMRKVPAYREHSIFCMKEIL
jgi:hypothetical protein